MMETKNFEKEYGNVKDVENLSRKRISVMRFVGKTKSLPFREGDWNCMWENRDVSYKTNLGFIRDVMNRYDTIIVTSDGSIYGLVGNMSYDIAYEAWGDSYDMIQDFFHENKNKQCIEFEYEEESGDEE